MRREEEEMSDFLCIGDYICLFCEDMEGYIYSWQSRWALLDHLYIFNYSIVHVEVYPYLN